MQWQLVTLYIISVICDLATLLILIRIVISWYSPQPTNILARILYRITELVLAPLRRVTRLALSPLFRIIPWLARFDFSPLLAVILIQLIYWVITLFIL